MKLLKGIALCCVVSCIGFSIAPSVNAAPPRLRGLNSYQEKVLRKLEDIYGNVDIRSLLLIASDLIKISKEWSLNLSMPREAARSKINLVAWFADNWDVILPLLNYVPLPGSIYKDTEDKSLDFLKFRILALKLLQEIVTTDL